VAVRFAPAADSPVDASELGLSRAELVDVLRYMLLHRGVEERGLLLYKQGKVPGSYYTGRGNEGAAVGTGLALRPEDVATATQRDMAVHIIRGLEPWRILAQYMGRVDGPARGRDANVHFADASLGMVAMVSHMGAMAPIAVGQALAFRIRGDRRVAVTWFGEGASVMGPIHEALNFAGVRRLPVVFVCDNNQWAYSTPANMEFPTEHVADRAAGYGFEGVVVDGTDVLAVYREAKRAVEKARDGSGPTLLECVTLRMEGHGAHDDSSYIPAELRAEWARRDPIDRYSAWLREHVGFTDDERAELTESISTLLREAVRRAEASPLPDPATLFDGVYAEPDQSEEGDR
jgi:TPP-dependent pyruvate/acetoin dehydrogenase alpha subunit